MKSCLVCDDHAMMRMALSGAVSMAWPDAIVSTAEDFDAAQAAARAGPDLILCDLSMPGATPLEGIKGVRAAAPETPLLVVTGNEDDALLLALFDLGIAGFVPKSASAEVIEAALRETAVPLQRHDTLEAATGWCFAQAQPGDAVLLSPACASLDMFRNYAHRAEVFVAAVQALAQARGEVAA